MLLSTNDLSLGVCTKKLPVKQNPIMPLIVHERHCDCWNSEHFVPSEEYFEDNSFAHALQRWENAILMDHDSKSDCVIVIFDRTDRKKV